MDAVEARLRAALGEPLVMAVEDALNPRLTRRPGEMPLVGRCSGQRVTAWRRLSAGGWTGQTRFDGELAPEENGTVLIGAIRLRWPFRVVLGVWALSLAALIVVSIVSAGPELFRSAGWIWALVGPLSWVLQRADRRELIENLGHIVRSP